MADKLKLKKIYAVVNGELWSCETYFDEPSSLASCASRSTGTTANASWYDFLLTIDTAVAFSLEHPK